MAPAFHIENFGCRAARADGEAMASGLSRLGLAPSPASEADVVVVNTCSVTAEADREARAWIRRAHRLNPGARIVVTGCYAQRAPEELAALPGVSAVVGNSHKALAPDIISQLTLTGPAAEASTPGQPLIPVHTLIRPESAPIWADDRFAHSFLEEAQVLPGAQPGSQTRPNLKIQEGCGNRCTFCVIPHTRGHSRSLPEEKVLAQVRGFVRAGGNELVLSGINLGRWGRDLPRDAIQANLHLAQLIRRIFAETELPRLRLSSIEPMDWDHELIALMREFGGRRLARHAHLPLQSGSDSVLRRMHRRYRPWHYAEKVHALREAAGPVLTLGADVMVGFPGETDREFQETFDLIRQLPFGYLHLFPFSPRPGTRGWDLHRQYPVPPGAVEQRMAVLRALAQEKSRAHRAAFAGQEIECLTLHTAEALRLRNRTAALTENFLPVELEGNHPANSRVLARIIGIGSSDALLGCAVGRAV
jgi:threonylcarbamoyladenosine tRNA methylthiotransferase MtaB